MEHMTARPVGFEVSRAGNGMLDVHSLYPRSLLLCSAGQDNGVCGERPGQCTPGQPCHGSAYVQL